MFLFPKTQASPASPAMDHFGTNIELARIIDLEIESFKEKIRVLKTRRNSLVLIARLPPEILSTVFQFLQANPPPLYYHTNNNKWIIVSHVCTHWRRVALECPSLWAQINLHVNGDIALGEAALERSKQAPLTLSVNVASSLQGVIQATLANLRRIRHLTLHLPVQLPTVDFPIDILETYPAPILERFSITGLPIGGASRPLAKLFGGVHPVLRELKLIGYSLMWDNFPSLGALVELHITCPPQPTLGQCPSIVQLASILRNTPNLRNLTICGTIPPPPAGLTVGSPILLPRLSRLYIQSDIDQCIELFDYISYPATSSIIVRTGSVTNLTLASVLGIIRRTLNSERFIGVRPSFQCLKIIPPSSLDYHDSTLFIEVWDDPGNIEHVPSCAPNVDLAINTPRNDPSFFTSPNTISLWNALPLEGLQNLYVVYPDLPKSLWMELGPRLECLTILKLGPYMDVNPIDILEVLSSTLASQGHDHDNPAKPTSLQVIYIPTLQELSISEWDFRTLSAGDEQVSELLGQLISVLRTRKEHGAEVKVMDINRCRHLSENGINQLKGVVSSVIWDEVEEATSEEEEEDESDYDDLPHGFWGY